MDRSILRDVVSQFVGDMGLAPKKGAGRIPTRFTLVQMAIENPAEVLEKPQRIKDLLFPDEVLPEGMSRSTLDENLQLLLRPEGLALVLSDELLFESGGSELGEGSRQLLTEFARFLATTSMPVNVAGYGQRPRNEQGQLRSVGGEDMAVQGVFLKTGFVQGDFRFPPTATRSPGGQRHAEGRARNRRVDIC
jgi:chemotaxis protein MotB